MLGPGMPMDNWSWWRQLRVPLRLGQMMPYRSRVPFHNPLVPRISRSAVGTSIGSSKLRSGRTATSRTPRRNSVFIGDNHSFSAAREHGHSQSREANIHRSGHLRLHSIDQRHSAAGSSSSLTHSQHVSHQSATGGDKHCSILTASIRFAILTSSAQLQCPALKEAGIFSAVSGLSTSVLR